MPPVPEIRIRSLTSAKDRTGDYVLYWMTATRRLSHNYALDRAIELSRRSREPLLILEPLNVDYRWACDRHHAAVIDGMLEHEADLRRTPIGYYAYVEPTPGAGRGLLAALAERASHLVTDDSPVFFTPRLLEAATALQATPVEAVDSCGLYPIRATDRAFGAAAHFRRHLQRALPEHLSNAPNEHPLRHVDIPSLPSLPSTVEDRWPRADLARLGSEAGLAGLPVEHTIGRTAWKGGTGPARERLAEFLGDGLERYGAERRDPDSDSASRLSPWLHFGHLSPHEVLRAVADAEWWSPARVSADASGARLGWWGMSSAAESFLDELVTWRELGYGYCTHVPDYDRYETLPRWALDTLAEHASDPRPHVYTLDQLTGAETHDDLWNAAQRQLVEEGVIHNYLRMLWGKKILGWTEHPRQAHAIMIELNNRYALDGRDPNSYSGIGWVLGRFDRGWPERAIFGKVRTMTSASARRRLRLDRYLAHWGGQSGLTL